MGESERQQRREGGQHQRLQRNQASDARRRRTEHPQHREVALALAHRVQQRHQHRQRRRQQQHAAEATQHVHAHPHHAQQPRGLQRRHRGLQPRLRVDPARQHHRGQRAAVAHQHHADLERGVRRGPGALVLVVRGVVVILGAVAIPGAVAGVVVVAPALRFMGRLRRVPMRRMGLPDRGQVRQHQPVDHTARRGQDAGHFIGLLVFLAATGQAVRAVEPVARL